MKDESAGLLAAAFIGVVPGYISRSVAGSYDNEAIAIFLLMFTFYCWIKALKQGSALFGTIAAVFYFYMVAAWGTLLKLFLAIHFSYRGRWLCFYHKHDPFARIGAYPYGPLFQPPLRELLVLVCHRNPRQHAGPICGLPAREYQRAYGRSWCVEYSTLREDILKTI